MYLRRPYRRSPQATQQQLEMCDVRPERTCEAALLRKKRSLDIKMKFMSLKILAAGSVVARHILSPFCPHPAQGVSKSANLYRIHLKNFEC
jgi:hypothetical protein